MATREERRAWRKEFEDLGERQTAEREAASIWHATPGKLQEARRWLRWQKMLPYTLGATIGAVASITGAIVGALITAFLGVDAKLSAEITGLKNEVAGLKADVSHVRDDSADRRGDGGVRHVMAARVTQGDARLRPAQERSWVATYSCG
jgi:hypothetical protein